MKGWPLGRIGDLNRGHRSFEVTQGVLVPGGSHGLPSGERQVTAEPMPIRARARVGEMVGDLGGVDIEVVAVEPFECVGHPQVKSPTAGLDSPARSV